MATTIFTSRSPLRSILHSPAQSKRIRSQITPESPPYRVAVLGAGGEIGRSLSLLIKMSPYVTSLNVHGTRSVRGVAENLNHCNTPCVVTDFSGSAGLSECVTGAHVVVVVSKSPVRPGMTHEDVFYDDVGAVKTCVEAVAEVNPDAFVHVVSNSVDFSVPAAAEVLKKKGVYDPKKLFGVTTLDVIRASTFVARKKKDLNLCDVSVPVVGGQGAWTTLPLLSKMRPQTNFTDQEVAELTARIRDAEKEVMEAKGGCGCATLSAAYAAARFVESSLRALDGDGDVYECAFVQSNVTELPFFASRVKLGRSGVEAVVSSDLENMTAFEEEALESLKPVLLKSIEKGLAAAAYNAHT